MPSDAEMLARLKRIADSGDEERLTPYVRWALERIAELEGALARYGNHEPGCLAGMLYNRTLCQCGLAEALAPAAAKEGEKQGG